MMNRKRLGSLLAAAALVLTGTVGYGLWNADKTASIVSLDVNPSIEIHVDEDGDVLKTESLNSDGEKVLEGMKLKGADADTAVNAIVGSLLRHGYIDNVANSILLTVEDEDTVRGAKLKEELTEEIHEILSATAINASILSQNMKETKLAKQENISEGKATLVENIVDSNETYKAEELADLSVNELNLILSNSKNKVENVEATGKATDAAYVGREKAKETALSHAGVKEADVRELDVEMDYEYKVMVYEVEFASGEYEYDYAIDAKSGEVLHSHREYDDDYVAPVVEKKDTQSKEATTEKQKETTTETKKKTSTATTKKQSETTIAKKEETVKEVVSTKEEPQVTDIGREKAKSIALSHAGVKESAASRLSVEKDYDDGRIEYSVEFTANGKEYDYEIHGESGKILDYDVEVEDRD